MFSTAKDRRRGERGVVSAANRRCRPKRFRIVALGTPAFPANQVPRRSRQTAPEAHKPPLHRPPLVRFIAGLFAGLRLPGYILKMILVVDDEDTVRSLVRTILEHAGHEVLEAANAAQALEMLSERTPDVLLTDIVMPGMNGLALAAEAHHRRPGIPVIFMSGFASRYADELIGSICLRKPFTANELLLAVGDVFSQEKTVRRLPQS
jgi:CheY-like chemotaxis protein